MIKLRFKTQRLERPLFQNNSTLWGVAQHFIIKSTKYKTLIKNKSLPASEKA